MPMKQALSTLSKSKPPRRGHDGRDLDPARMSARESKLIELHAQIVQLERNLGAHRGDDLATYVAALRERVEECLE